MREAVIVAGARTPLGKGIKGTLRNTRPDELAQRVISAAVSRTPGLKTDQIDDVIIGCAMPEGPQGMNVARIASLRSGLPVTVPGLTINRFCASGLQSIAFAANQIRCGCADVVIAGGTESMSLVPLGGETFSPNPYLVDSYPDVYLNMGLTAENLGRKYSISRSDQDLFAYQSHQKSLHAIKTSRFKDEIIPLEIPVAGIRPNGDTYSLKSKFEIDECPRIDTNIDTLKKLLPVFDKKGTVTAGNAAQLSDGAAAVVVTSKEKAIEQEWKILGRFVSFTTVGVKPEEMGIGPIMAIPKVLANAGLDKSSIGLIELNEAFAVQALTVINKLSLDPNKINVNGGAIGLGHPLGCTGTRLTITLLHEMKKQNIQYGLVSMCVGGGMGVAAIFEQLS
jgi:acetyl-CoA acyltransferase